MDTNVKDATARNTGILFAGAVWSKRVIHGIVIYAGIAAIGVSGIAKNAINVRMACRSPASIAAMTLG